MEAKKTNFFIGEGSGYLSDFSVFEGFSQAGTLLKEKAVSVGNYFCVGQVSDSKIYPSNIAKYNLFLAGHLPYTTDDNFPRSRRKYSRLVTGFNISTYEQDFSPAQIDEIKRLSAMRLKDEYRFCQSQIYRLENSDMDFSLVMKNGDWLNPQKGEDFFAEIVKERQVAVLSESGIFKYCPTVDTEQSRGYFLKGFEYLVKSILVGTPSDNMSGYTQKVLCIDILSGVPGFVPFFKNAEEFLLIE